MLKLSKKDYAYINIYASNLTKNKWYASKYY